MKTDMKTEFLQFNKSFTDTLANIPISLNTTNNLQKPLENKNNKNHLLDNNEKYLSLLFNFCLNIVSN